MRQNTNIEGVWLGPHGYVLCRDCGEEVQEVSREVSAEYAYHPRCRPTLFGYTDQRERFAQFLERRKNATN